MPTTSVICACCLPRRGARNWLKRFTAPAVGRAGRDCERRGWGLVDDAFARRRRAAPRGGRRPACWLADPEAVREDADDGDDLVAADAGGGDVEGRGLHR